MYARTDNTAKYLALSEDHAHYFLLNSLDQCTTTDSLLLCKAEFPILGSSIKTCERLSLDRVHDDTFCEKTLLTDFDPVFIYLDEAWLYSVTNKINFKLTCSKSELNKNVVIEGSGLLFIPSNCGLYNPNYKLLTTTYYHANSSLTLHDMKLHSVANAAATLNYDIKDTQPKLYSMDDILAVLSNLSMPSSNSPSVDNITKLMNEINTIPILETPINQKGMSTHDMTLYILMVFLCLLTIGAIFCLRRGKITYYFPRAARGGPTSSRREALSCLKQQTTGNESLALSCLKQQGTGNESLAKESVEMPIMKEAIEGMEATPVSASISPVSTSTSSSVSTSSARAQKI